AARLARRTTAPAMPVAWAVPVGGRAHPRNRGFIRVGKRRPDHLLPFLELLPGQQGQNFFDGCFLGQPRWPPPHSLAAAPRSAGTERRPELFPLDFADRLALIFGEVEGLHDSGVFEREESKELQDDFVQALSLFCIQEPFDRVIVALGGVEDL